MSKYGHRPHNWFEEIVDKIGGEDAAEKFLRNEISVGVATPHAFPIWKTIKPSIVAKSISDTVTEEVEIDLVNVSAGELGFRDGANYKRILERAQELGLQLCPDKAHSGLDPQCKDEPEGERLLIAMDHCLTTVHKYRFHEESYVSDGDGFEHAYPNNPYGVIAYANFERVWTANTRFVFVLPRKSVINPKTIGTLVLLD